jgi:hypothetical protein
MTELTVVLKDAHRTYKQKFLVYEPYSVSSSDSFIRSCIDKARADFDGEPDDVIIKIHMQVL